MALQETPNSPAVRRLNDARKGMLRSRVTNGRSPFVETDARGAWARRWRDIHAEIVSDLGGADALSEGQRQLVRRATTMSIQCELLEGRIAKGEAVDNEALDIYGKLTDRIGRCFQRLGLRRQARTVGGPSLGELLRDDQHRGNGHVDR